MPSRLISRRCLSIPRNGGRCKLSPIVLPASERTRTSLLTSRKECISISTPEYPMVCMITEHCRGRTALTRLLCVDAAFAPETGLLITGPTRPSLCGLLGIALGRTELLMARALHTTPCTPIAYNTFYTHCIQHLLRPPPRFPPYPCRPPRKPRYPVSDSACRCRCGCSGGRRRYTPGSAPTSSTLPTLCLQCVCVCVRACVPFFKRVA